MPDTPVIKAVAIKRLVKELFQFTIPSVQSGGFHIQSGRAARYPEFWQAHLYYYVV
jgi:hypothetical protein